MTGSGGCCVHGQKGEVTMTHFGVRCDTRLPELHSNGSWCGSSASFSDSVCRHSCKSRQRGQRIHGPASLPSSSHISGQNWTLGLGPCANSLHNYLWYFIVIVLILSQSLSVSAQSYSRTPSSGRVAEGQDYIFLCASSDPTQLPLWLKGSNVLFRQGQKISGTPDRYSLVNGSDLKITGVTPADNGNFSCQAGIARSRVAVLTVLVAPGQPVITPDTSTYNLTEGTTLSLNCTSEGGNPSPDIVWKKNGEELVGVGVTRTTGTATFNQLTIQLEWTDHQAIYSCDVSNEVNAAQPLTAEQTILVKYAPRITFSPYDPYISGLGQTATLKCEVNANPSNRLSYKWSKDGILRGERSDTLLFRPVQKSDAGEYTCGVFNGIGPERTRTVRLDVQYAPEILNVPSQLIVNETDRVNLTCIADSNPVADAPMWKNSNNNNRLTTWFFSSITKEDADNYTCTVTNVLTLSATASSQKTTQKTVELLVQYRPGLPKFAPVNQPNVGNTVEMTCLLDDPGYPAGTFEWQKQTESEIHSGQVYTIRRAELNDSGIYKCRGRNLLGPGDWAQMQLTINEPPRFVSPLPSSRNVTITDQNVQLQCKVRGRPKPKIEWKKNGISVHEGGLGAFYQIRQEPAEEVDRYSYIVTSTILFLGSGRPHKDDGGKDQLVMEDTANYTCESGEVISQTIQIFVQSPPEVTVTPQKLAPNFNSSVTFTCHGKANPEPNFKWQFKSNDLNSAGKYRIQYEGRGSKEYEYMSLLTVSDIAQEDQGDYKCTVTNTLGANANIAYIVPKSKPEAPTELKALEISWTSIFLQWAPGFNGGEEQTYVVYYTSAMNSGAYNAPRTPFNITGLLPSVTYALTVGGKNMHGVGPQSTPLNITTGPFNFTAPTAVKFDKASNTLSFDEPGPGYFAKVEVLVNSEWQVAEERANTEGGSIKLKQENVKKCRVSFCMEGQPQACSEPVEAEPVGDATTANNGDLSTEGVVAIACVCAVIIIGLCIALYCVIRKRKQDKAAKDYELETQANRRSQPINNPKDIVPKRGYDNPDFSSHQIQRNGHISPPPVANGKPPQYKPNVNMENSFESRDIQKYDEYDSHRHQSYGEEPLNFVPYSSLYYGPGDPYYNSDGPRDYLERPPSTMKDPNMSGQESGYSTPEPTKPKKLPKFLQRKRGLVYYADSAAFSHNPPGHTCGLPCCQAGNDLQILLGSSRANCVGVHTSCNTSNFSLGRANRNLLQGRPTFKNGNFSLRPFSDQERSRLPDFADLSSKGYVESSVISSSGDELNFSKRPAGPYQISGNGVKDRDEPLQLADFAVGESADDFEDSEGPMPYYQVLPFRKDSDSKYNTSGSKDRSETSEGDSGVYDRPESTESLHHVYAALPLVSNKSGFPVDKHSTKLRIPPTYTEAMATRLANKLAQLKTDDTINEQDTGIMSTNDPAQSVASLAAGIPDVPDDRYSTFPKSKPFMSGLASGLMNSFPDQQPVNRHSDSEFSSDMEEELGYFDNQQTENEAEGHSHLSLGESFTDDEYEKSRGWSDSPSACDNRIDQNETCNMTNDYQYAASFQDEFSDGEENPITLIL